MDVWFLFTILGEPEFWISSSLFLLGIYFLARGLRPKKKCVWFRRFIIILLPSLFVTYLAVYGLKTAFAIPRQCMPCPAELCNPYCTEDFSFPSGHAAAIFTVFTSLLLAARKYRKHVIVGYVIPLIVSLSRVALGVHTYIDIITGSAIGITIPILVWYLFGKKEIIRMLKI